ncbi:MAG: hypothetical protein A2Z37_04090 [Chloroflexi bacterium RBG_19FT_COMBO_62_14]|nr:MAG: hypothetical protein A2Z37_04090 [Chloroflexi bacterium RBG_19FT_COMBO_62_14]
MAAIVLSSLGSALVETTSGKTALGRAELVRPESGAMRQPGRDARRITRIRIKTRGKMSRK